MTQIGKFEFYGELVINGSCCISKGEGWGVGWVCISGDGYGLRTNFGVAISRIPKFL